MKRAARGLLAVLVAAITVLVGAQQPAYAADYGSVGPVYGASTTAPTGEKPQSKLWVADGIWWGALFDSVSKDFHIFRYDWAANSWSDTGTLIDGRTNIYLDVLWDGKYLYVVSAGTNAASSTHSPKLTRFLYSTKNKKWTRSAGYPITPMGNGGVEAAVIAKDSTGLLWATYTQGSKVYVVHSVADDDRTWVPRYQVPTPSNESSVDPDDLSAIVSYDGNKIGVLWSNQIRGIETMYWAWHQDGTSDQAWNLQVAYQQPEGADDHMNIKSLVGDTSGRVFAAAKTSMNGSTDPLINLLVLNEAGQWSATKVWTVKDQGTRAIVQIDTQARELYVFAAAPCCAGGTIYYKKTALDNIQFATGLGTPFIHSDAHPEANNPASTKQNVNGTTGLLVIASDDQTRTYLYNRLTLGGTPTDTTPPDTTITSAPTAITTSTGATFAFTSTEAGSTFACKLDTTTPTACTTPMSYTGLGNGAHTFTVTATDPSGNPDPTPAAHTWTVDNSPPDTTITSAPPASNSSTGATFAFTSTEAASTFACQLDSDAAAACTSAKSYTGLSAGAHTFAVTATDLVGNPDPTPATHSWTVDTSPPDTTITSAPAATTSSTGATFAFTSTEAESTFACQLDTGSTSACSTPASYTGFGAGDHTFTVTATDPAGNPDPTPATHTWTVDTSPPDTTITSGPPATTTDTGATFDFTSTEPGSTFACQLDTDASTSCTTPKSYLGLTVGAHIVTVTATDPAGNPDPDPATYAWTVEGGPVAPDTTITSAPPATTNSADATFDFTSTEAESTFTCKLDTGTPAACTSPNSYGGLGDGAHTFTVTATDAANTPDPTPATHTWTVDTTAPDTRIESSGPPATTTDTSATFEFTSTEAGSAFACELDGGTTTTCTSAKTYLDLAVGDHTFAVTATDPAGNPDPTPATHRWTVEAGPVAPDTTITSAPPAITTSTDATFGFSSNDPGSTFACKLDTAEPTSCTTSMNYTGLGEGAHTFTVTATDPAGTPDPTPASHTWTVDTAAPDTSIESSPALTTTDISATFEFTSTEAGSAFTCKLDGGTAAPCTSLTTYTGLTEGAHTFTVAATDPAGNPDLTPATHTWTVDTSPPETTITAVPAVTTTDTSATFEFNSTETESTFSCKLDGGTSTNCTSPKIYTGLAVGSHTFTVTATDPAGNTDPTPATHTWTVNTAALFSDDFSSSGFTAGGWAVGVGADGTATVVSGAVQPADLGARLVSTTATGSTASIRETFAAPQQGLTIGWDARVVQAASTQVFALAKLYGSSGRVLTLIRDGATGTLSVQDASTTIVPTTASLPIGAVARLTLTVVQGTSDSLTLSVNGVGVYSSSSVNLGSSAFTSVRMGDDSVRRSLDYRVDNVEVTP